MRGATVCQYVAMKSDVLAPSWMFRYFKAFGLHFHCSSHKNPAKSFLFYYQLGILLMLFADFVWSFDALLFDADLGSTTLLVGVLESKNKSLWISSCWRIKFKIIFFFEDTFFISATSSSILCSIKFQMKKQQIFQEFHSFDKFSAENLKYKINYGTLYKRLTRRFTVLWILSTSICFLSLLVNRNGNLRMIIYIVKVTTMAHIVHVQGFQIIVFTHGFLSRLELVAKFSKNQDTILLNLSLQKLYEINKSVNDWLQINLFFILIHNYATLIINSYWIGLTYLGAPWSSSCISKLLTFI